MTQAIENDLYFKRMLTDLREGNIPLWGRRVTTTENIEVIVSVPKLPLILRYGTDKKWQTVKLPITLDNGFVIESWPPDSVEYYGEGYFREIQLDLDKNGVNLDE